MKYKPKRLPYTLLTLALALAIGVFAIVSMIAGATESTDTAGTGINNFVKINTFAPGKFTDVDEDEWYGFNNQKVVAGAYEYGLMRGDSDTTFNPAGNVTVAQAITVAARVHSIYTTGKESFVEGGASWYQVYVDYALANNIIAANDFSDYTRAATRAEMAFIFSRSLPLAEFTEQNTVNSLPDVTSGTPYLESILTLYEAGVVGGSDDLGTFNPGSNIIRAEAAAIISRVILPATRFKDKAYPPGSGTGETPEPPEGESIPVRLSVSIPENATDEERAAYAFIESSLVICELGFEFYDLGLTIAAQYPFGTAAANICSMRRAVDILIEYKGFAPQADGRLNDWDEIAALGWASQYPYIFEGVVLEAGGNKTAAMECYRKAAYNPALSEGDHLVRCITLLDVRQLSELRSALVSLEDEIFAVYTPVTTKIPRHEYNCHPAYLRAQGLAALGQAADESDLDVDAALPYYHAALSIEPFNGNNYACLAALYLQAEQVQTATYMLNEGLFVDPDNQILKALYDSMKGVL